MLKSKYLFKVLSKFRQDPKNKIFNLFNIDYIATLILGIIFTIPFWLKPSNLIVSIKEYNLLTYSLLSFFILQKNNFIITNSDKNNFLAQFSISNYKIHLADNIILYKECIINLVVFNIPLIIYLLNVAPINLLGSLFSLLIISLSSVLSCELVKVSILLLSKLSSFIYQIKKVLLTIFFSILYFFIIRYPNLLNDNQYFIFYYFHIGYYFISTGFNLYSFLIYLVIIAFSLIIYWGLAPLINIINYKVKNDSFCKKIRYNKTYQENAIKGITNSLVKNDLVLHEAYLNQMLEFIFRFLWLVILLYSSKAFAGISSTIFIASVITIFSLAKELDIMLIKTKSFVSNQFKILNNYSDKAIFNQFLKNTLLFKLVFFLIPLICINLFFNNLLNSVLIAITLIFIFGSSYYFHYLFINKEALFTLNSSSEKLVSDKIMVMNLGLIIYLMLMFTSNKISLFSLLVLIVVFIIPFLLFITTLFQLKFSYFPKRRPQSNNYSCGRVALKNLLFFYNKDISISKFSISEEGDSLNSLIEFAKHYQVELKAYQDVLINEINTKCIALIKLHGGYHYVVLSEVQNNYFIIIDSLKRNTIAISKKKFSKIFANIIIKKIN